ncbi:MAG: 2-amino-4-hydroxy-6-hydroxymethyldihydropteridine diphosphokinase [Spirochaetia bacterium]
MSARIPRGSPRSSDYFIALGSNLGDREAALRRAWAMLTDFCLGGSGLAELSPLYETRPMYVVDQPLYLNAVGRVSCGIKPKFMLDHLHRIEKEMGRDRAKEMRMGPRTVDLDILLCGDLVMDSPALTIPHPRMTERMFVLVPLLALSPRLRDPRTGVRYAESLALLRSGIEETDAGGVYLYPSG